MLTICRSNIKSACQKLFQLLWHNLVIRLFYFPFRYDLNTVCKFSFSSPCLRALPDHSSLACVVSHNAFLYAVAIKVSSAWRDLLMLCLVMFIIFLYSMHLMAHQHVNTARSYLHLPYLELKYSTWPGRISAFQSVHLMSNRPRLAVLIYGHNSEQCWSLSVNLNLSLLFLFLHSVIWEETDFSVKMFSRASIR